MPFVCPTPGTKMIVPVSPGFPIGREFVWPAPGGTITIGLTKKEPLLIETLAACADRNKHAKTTKKQHRVIVFIDVCHDPLQLVNLLDFTTDC